MNFKIGDTIFYSLQKAVVIDNKDNDENNFHPHIRIRFFDNKERWVKSSECEYNWAIGEDVFHSKYGDGIVVDTWWENNCGILNTGEIKIVFDDADNYQTVKNNHMLSKRSFKFNNINQEKPSFQKEDKVLLKNSTIQGTVKKIWLIDKTQEIDGYEVHFPFNVRNYTTFINADDLELIPKHYTLKDLKENDLITWSDGKQGNYSVDDNLTETECKDIVKVERPTYTLVEPHD